MYVLGSPKFAFCGHDFARLLVNIPWYAVAAIVIYLGPHVLGWINLVPPDFGPTGWQTFAVFLVTLAVEAAKKYATDTRVVKQ